MRPAFGRKLFLSPILSPILMIILVFFLVGCENVPAPKTEIDLMVDEAQNIQPAPETVPGLVKEIEGCEYNSDCEQGLLCIDKECKTLTSLFKTDCENKCTITSVSVKTSDGEEYDLTLGQGSYTAAGALEWKLMKTPDYCPGEEPLVAVNIIKKTTGKIVGEQILTLHKGETSEQVTHPTVKSVKFTAALAEVTEICS